MLCTHVLHQQLIVANIKEKVPIFFNYSKFLFSSNLSYWAVLSSTKFNCRFPEGQVSIKLHFGVTVGDHYLLLLLWPPILHDVHLNDTRMSLIVLCHITIVLWHGPILCEKPFSLSMSTHNCLAPFYLALQLSLLLGPVRNQNLPSRGD